MRSLTPCLVALLAVVCGCEDEGRVILLRRVVPEADPLCGAPADGRTLVVSALGDFAAQSSYAQSSAIAAGATLEVAAFPENTRVLRVSVLGSGGALRVVGETVPFFLGDLEPGAEVPVFMAPPRGLCPTGPPLHARTRPLVAAVAGGVVIAGGRGPDGAAVPAVERYDPNTGRFQEIARLRPGEPRHGLYGASLTPLGFPRAGSSPGASSASVQVLIAGGVTPSYLVLDGSTGETSAEFFLSPGHAHHSALALDDHQVLLIGGCGLPVSESGDCLPAMVHRRTTIVDIATNQTRPGPGLRRVRLGGMALRESAETVLLVGGVDERGAPALEIERLYLAGARDSELIAPSVPVPIEVAAPPLPGGALLLAGEQALALPPAGRAMAAAANVPAGFVAETLTPLFDGRLLATGTDGDQVAAYLYEPGNRRFLAVAGPGFPASGHAAVRLDDGTVLLVGMDAAAQPSASVFRPDLTGPYSSDVSVAFGDVELAAPVIPADPAYADIVPAEAGAPARLRLIASPNATGPDTPSQWAIVAGPVFTHAEVRVRGRVGDGAGMAVVFGFGTGQGYAAALLVPGAEARVVHVTGVGAPGVELCRGSVVGIDALSAERSHDVVLTLASGALKAVIDDAPAAVLDCHEAELGMVPAGHIGVGVLGAAGAAVYIDSIVASR